MGLLLLFLSTLWTISVATRQVYWGIIPNGMTDPLPPYPNSPSNAIFVLNAYKNSQLKFQVMLDWYDDSVDYGTSGGIKSVDTGLIPAGTTIDTSTCSSSTGVKNCKFWVTINPPIPNTWLVTFQANDQSGSFSCPWNINLNLIDAPQPTHRPGNQNGQWKLGSWGTCDRSCGTGFQTRTVTCMVGSSASSPADCPDPTPASQQTCNTQSCSSDYNRFWNYFGSDNCPSLCTLTPVSKRMPQFRCRVGGTDTAGGDCSGDHYSPPSPVCYANFGCSWVPGKYDSCSSGTTGTQARIVECRTSDGYHAYDVDCTQNAVSNPYPLSRTCIPPPTLAQSQFDHSLVVGVSTLTISGTNFATDGSTNTVTFLTSNSSLTLDVASLQVTSSTQAVVTLQNSVTSDLTGVKWIKAQFDNENYETSGWVVVYGKSAATIRYSLSFTLLFLVSFFTIMITM